MSSFPMEVGRVVFSRAGRDQGHYFVIVDVIDEDHVAIANGCQRKVDNPKKKKIKHLVQSPKFLKKFEKKFLQKRGFLTLKCEINWMLSAIKRHCCRVRRVNVAQERQYRG